METMKTMSCQDHGSAWRHCSTDLAAAAAGGGADFLGLFGDLHSSSDDLFELVWRGGDGGGKEGQPSCKPLSSRRRFADALVPVPERLAVAPRPAPPSEAEMASWLFPIVSGEALAGGGDGAVVAGRRARVDDDQMVPSVKESSDHKLQKRKTAPTEGTRSHHHHAEAHSLTEKRRRLKIKEKFKTLQQVVPGCHNSNQASTLDQTIRYMKSLKQHIQAMSFRCGMKPTSVTIYPVVQQPPCLSICCQTRGAWVQGWLLGGPQL